MATRLFSRHLARELSLDEMARVGGADDPPPEPNPVFTWICQWNANGCDEFVYVRD
ncbi:MAG TPA: hypothetical protein VF702_05265 [Allosphingosinicella sp.]|jgi:hypothetical protein